MDNKLIIAQPRLWLEEPHNCTDARDVLTILTSFFDSLVAYDSQMNYIPALAESWVVSDDARTWTFTLRPDIKFHHGRPVDAEAVAYSLRRMARPDMGVTLGAPGVYNQYLAGIKLEILDRKRLRLNLAEPMADLLDVLVTGYILPPDAVERLGGQFKDTPIGTGPFEFVEHEEGVCVRGTQNRNYFKGPPNFEAIEWRMAPDPDERLSMVREGRAHIAAGPPYAATLKDDDVHYVRSRGTTVYIIIFNTKSRDLVDPRVRLALNLAVDRRALIDTDIP